MIGNEEVCECGQEFTTCQPGSLCPKCEEMLQHCRKCGTKIQCASGVALYCPNKDCDVFDDVLGLGPITTKEDV